MSPTSQSTVPSTTAEIPASPHTPVTPSGLREEHHPLPQTDQDSNGRKSLEHDAPQSLVERLAYSPERKVVIALDESQYARKALDWAMRNFLRPGEDMAILTHCREPVAAPIAYDGGLGVGYYDFTDYTSKIEQSNRQKSHQMLKDYAHVLQHAGIKVKAYALRGDAREAITDKVKEVNPDTVIVGSRGLGALKRTFIGSTSDYLVHHLECPVVIVKVKDEEENL